MYVSRNRYRERESENICGFEMCHYLLDLSYKILLLIKWFYVLGLAHMVYPGAMHSRFEHSLGVYWLAGESVEKLKSYQV